MFGPVAGWHALLVTAILLLLAGLAHLPGLLRLMRRRGRVETAVADAPGGERSRAPEPAGEERRAA